MKRHLTLENLAIAACLLTLAYIIGRPLARYLTRDRGFTVAQRVEQFRASFDERLRPELLKAGVTGIPQAATLVFLKDKRTLELWAELWADRAGAMVFVKEYAVTAASGKPGPKLREGDFQVPEGIYRVEALNPNSKFHLSLRLDYPNEFDRVRGREDGRENLGGDIMIHGNRVSIGCIAIGDEAIEEIFLLAAQSDWSKWKVILAPVDLRDGRKVQVNSVPWSGILYDQLRSELEQLRRTQSPI